MFDIRKRNDLQQLKFNLKSEKQLEAAKLEKKIGTQGFLNDMKKTFDLVTN